MHLTCLSAAHQGVERVGHDDACCALLVPGAVLVARQIHRHVHEQGRAGVHLCIGEGSGQIVNAGYLLAVTTECCIDRLPGTLAHTRAGLHGSAPAGQGCGGKCEGDGPACTCVRVLYRVCARHPGRHMSRAEWGCICRGKAGRTRMPSPGKGRGEGDGPACTYFRVLH